MSKTNAIPKNQRHFTYAQIQEKVSQRYNIPSYYDILLQCAVGHDDSGVYFDVKHPAWRRLLRLVKEVPLPSDASGTFHINTPSKHDIQQVVYRHLDLRRKDDISAGPGADLPLPPGTHNQSPSPKPKRLFPEPPQHSPHKRSKDEWLELLTNELVSDAPDVDIVRAACLVTGIPSNFRVNIWRILLDCGDDRLMKIRSRGAPLSNQRVIVADVERTRSNLPTFRDENVRKEMEIILTHYCRSKGISYKQGMNYLLAPFYLIQMKQRAVIYTSFSAVIQRFIPNTFTDEEFGSLQCLFRLFRILLLYHDPSLCNFLDQYDMSPELYASSWFMTLFANRLDIPELLLLWDHLLLENNPFFHYFVSLAVLLRHRDTIVDQTRTVELPEVLSKLMLSSKDEVRSAVQHAKDLFADTPQSFCELLGRVTTGVVEVGGALYTRVESMLCMPVNTEELLNNCYSSSSSISSPSTSPPASPTPDTPASSAFRFFVLDCRSEPQFESGHLPSAWHLDPSLYLRPEELAEKVDSLLAMNGCHFCFSAEGEHHGHPSNGMLSLNLYFLQKGFKHISMCEGGYHKSHAVISRTEGLELVDHHSDRCHECNPPKAKGLFSSLRRIASSVQGPSANRKRSKSTAVGAPSTPVSGLASTVAPGGEYSGVPHSVMVLPTSCELMLLLTILHDQGTTCQKFRSCTHRLLSLLCASALEFIKIKETTVTSPNNQPCRGFHTVLSVYGVSLSESGESALRLALEVYSPVASTAVGQLKFQDSFEKDASGVLRSQRTSVAYVPDDISKRLVFLFHPVVSASSLPLVFESLKDLVERAVPTQNITILCLCASRQALWKLSEQFASVRLVCASVEEYSKGKGLMPGIGKFEMRYAMSHES